MVSDLVKMSWRTGAIDGASSFNTLSRIASGPAALFGLRFWSSLEKFFRKV